MLHMFQGDAADVSKHIPYMHVSRFMLIYEQLMLRLMQCKCPQCKPNTLGVTNNTTMFPSKFKLSYLLYSYAIELEYSFNVIILTYELAYSLCVMILTCPYGMILAYELDYSFYARVLSYKTLCLNIHTICLLGFRAKYKWWFIMPLSTPKFFTCRAVGSETTGGLGWSLYTQARCLSI
jgi:hypothetical protein